MFKNNVHLSIQTFSLKSLKNEIYIEQIKRPPCAFGDMYPVPVLGVSQLCTYAQGQTRPQHSLYYQICIRSSKSC